jgi:hypothetical protein
MQLFSQTELRHILNQKNSEHAYSEWRTEYCGAANVRFVPILLQKSAIGVVGRPLARLR